MIEVLKPYFIANSASDEDVSVEERNLLSVAYKNAVGMRRIAWRAVKKASKTQKFLAYADHSTNYMKDLEEETVELCKDMLNLITKHLIPRAKRAGSYESQVFFFKLLGDYFRYVAEVSEGERNQKATERALLNYNDGIGLAEHLEPAEPTRLALQLNYSIICFENLDLKEQALDIANQAFEEAVEHIKSLDRGKRSEAQTILQFLKENITSWKQAINDANGENSKRNLFS